MYTLHSARVFRSVQQPSQPGIQPRSGRKSCNVVGILGIHLEMDHMLPLQPMPWTLARPPRFPLVLVVKLVEQEQLVLLVEQEEHMLQEQLVELEGMLELQAVLVLQDKLAEQAVLADMQEQVLQVLLVAKEIVDSHSIHN